MGFHNKDNPSIHTPVMDWLATNGIELSRHYVASHGAPSRSALQSGRLPVHVNLGSTDGLTDAHHGIPPDMTGLASKLGESEYAYSTHLVGKWDCGFATYWQLPTRKGYDSFYGYLSKSMDYFKKPKIHNDGCVCSSLQFHDLWQDEQPLHDQEEDEYSELLFNGRVLDIIESHTNTQAADEEARPLFIMLSALRVCMLFIIC